MKNHTHLIPVLGSLLLISVYPTQAKTLGIHFDAGAEIPPAVSAGVVPQTNFNNEHGASGTAITNLVFSDGTPAGVSLSYSAPDVFLVPNAATTGDELLFKGFLDSSDSEGTTIVTLTGLGPGLHTLELYIAGDQVKGIRGGNYRINGTAYTLGNDGVATAFPGGKYKLAVPGTYTRFSDSFSGTGGNYFTAKFTGDSLTITATPGFGEFLRTPINGLQVITP